MSQTAGGGVVIDVPGAAAPPPIHTKQPPFPPGHPEDAPPRGGNVDPHDDLQEDRADLVASRPVVLFSRTQAAVHLLRQQYAGTSFKVQDKAGMAQAKAARKALVALRGQVEARRVTLKAPFLEGCRLVDQTAKQLTQELTAIEAPIDVLISTEERLQHERKTQADREEAERVRQREAWLRAIQELPAQAARWAPAQFEAAAATLAQHRARAWQEYAERARLAIDSAEETLRLLREALAERDARQRREHEAAARHQRMEAITAMAGAPGTLVGMSSVFIAQQINSLQQPAPAQFGDLLPVAVATWQASVSAMRQMLDEAHDREAAEAELVVRRAADRARQPRFSAAGSAAANPDHPHPAGHPGSKPMSTTAMSTTAMSITEQHQDMTPAAIATIAANNGKAPLWAALAKAQGEFPPIEKNRSASIRPRDPARAPYAYRYADLEEILSKTRPALAKHALALTQLVTREASDTVIRTILGHASGATLETVLRLDHPPGADIKEFGIRIAYLRRYKVQSLLGVAADDDSDADGVEPGTGEGFSTDDTPLHEGMREARSISELSRIMAGLKREDKARFAGQFAQRQEALRGQEAPTHPAGAEG